MHEQDNNGVCKEYEVACWATVYFINRGPSTPLDFGILEEAWIGKKVSYSFLKTFGCEKFAQIDSENRTKQEAKSKKCVLFGCH